MLLFTIIIGGIYGSVFTAIEAAAISAFAVIVIGSLQKRLTWSHFTLSIKDIFTQTTSIFFTTASANIFVGFVPLTGMAPTLGGIVEDADVSLCSGRPSCAPATGYRSR